MKSSIIMFLCVLGGLSLAACNDDSGNNAPFTRNDNGTVTDSNGITCQVDNGSWADCYQSTYKSYCKNGKAVVCGNLYTNFEVFEYDCNCSMVDGKATCGECQPGEIGLRDTENGRLVMCNPAGLWQEINIPLSDPDEMKPCDPLTYRSNCKNGVALECSELDGRIHASDCASSPDWNNCVEVDEPYEETEFNQYTLLCESQKHRAYCSECRPGEEAEAETVCLSLYTLNTAPMKCSEFGFWIDKETGDIPQSKHCDSACAQGRCLGNFVTCTPEEVRDHVCYTEDSFVIDSVTCMITGEKWADFFEPLRIEYCAGGCIDNVCHKE